MLWSYLPDWSNPITERLEWQTDVLSAYDGSEQRVALRQAPRRSIEFSFLIVGDTQRRDVEVKLWANGAKLWDVPLWTDTVYSDASVSAGSNTIMVTTTHLDFVAGNKVLLQSSTGRFHLSTIATVNSNSLILSEYLAADWPIETAVTPVRSGYLDPSQQVTRFTGDAIYDVVRFTFDDVSTYTADDGSGVYRGYPVVAIASTWANDLTLNYERKMQTVDFGNNIFRDDESGLPAMIHSHTWMLKSREEISNFRAFLYARRGRLNACWLPTFQNDLQIVDTITSGSLQINIENCSYTDLYQMHINRRDIRIELVSGTLIYRRIIASSIINDDVEQITIDAALGVDLAIDDIERISFMSFCRLEADSIELSWQWSDLVNVGANFRTTNNDV